MKMAKASQADLDMAMDLSNAIRELTRPWPMLPPGMLNTADDTRHEEFERDDDRQCGVVLRHLLGIAERGSLDRVVFGFAVLLDPQNKCVDPVAHTLEAHPETVAAKKNADRYGWLRAQNWFDNTICAVRSPKDAMKLGHDAPSLERLDALIDEAMQAGSTEAAEPAAPSVAPEPPEPDDLPSQLDTIIESCSEAAWAMRNAPEPLDPGITYDPFKELVRLAYAMGYDQGAHPGDYARSVAPEPLCLEETGAILDLLKAEHDGTDFEPECPLCTAYRKLSGGIRAGGAPSAAPEVLALPAAHEATRQRLRREAERQYQRISGGHLFDSDAVCVRCGFDGAEWHHLKTHTHEGDASDEGEPLCTGPAGGRAVP